MSGCSGCGCVQAKSMDQKRTWCQAVKKLIIENFHKSIPDRAKQVVLGGVDKEEKGRQRAGETVTWPGVLTFTGVL